MSATRGAVVAAVGRTHLTVWRAELRQVLGGTGRLTVAGVVAAAFVGLTAVLSWGLAPDLTGTTAGDRAARAVLAVVFVVGALIWTALSLALPDTSAVDTVLTAVPASAADRRIGLAVITVAPALTITLCAALAVSGGLIRTGPGDAVAAGVVVLGSAVAGVGTGALSAGLIAGALGRLRLVGPATCRGLAAATVVLVLAAALARLMADVDAPSAPTNPLGWVGRAGERALTHPAAGVPLAVAAILLGAAAVVAGAAAARSFPATAAARARRFLGRLGRPAPRPAWTTLQAAQLRRHQPNVGLGVLVGIGALLTVVAAPGRSAVFAHSMFFALGSLATTSAVTVAGVEGRAAWLYHATGRWPGHVGTRLAAYVVGWFTFLTAFGGLLAWRSPGFGAGDATGLLPLLCLELGLVVLVGALIPVSEEHGLSTMSGEFAAIVIVLLVAFGLPRVPWLGTSGLAMNVVGVGGGLLGLAGCAAVMLGRSPGPPRTTGP